MFNITVPTPRMGRVVVPDGKSISICGGEPTDLTAERLAEVALRHQRFAGNFSKFYAAVVDGVLLNQILRLTSQTSYMADMLNGVQSDASISNIFTQLLHTEHTFSVHEAHYLPMVSIFFDYFSSTPIPENIAAVKDGNASLAALAVLAEKSREFYDRVLKGVAMPRMSDSAAFGYDGLEFTVFGDDMPVTPKIISAKASTITLDGQVYYNGLPHDRQRYPTFLMPERTNLVLRVRNTTKDKLYAVVPTVNGIPLRTERVVLDYNGFARSSLPVMQVEPHLQYVKPGEEFDFAGFFCNAVKISPHRGISIASCLGDFGSVDEHTAELSFIVSHLFEKAISPEMAATLATCSDQGVIERIRYESRVSAVKQFLKYLGQAKTADIHLINPVVADGKASSELDNPFLGSIGIAIVEVTAPPVKDEHVHIEIYHSTRDVMMKGTGSAGLANISGGFDRTARRLDFWNDTFRYHEMIHTFKGYMPLNLMALRQ